MSTNENTYGKGNFEVSRKYKDAKKKSLRSGKVEMPGKQEEA
jgi:hypothetical protein